MHKLPVCQEPEQDRGSETTEAWPSREELMRLVPPSLCNLLSVLLQGIGLRSALAPMECGLHWKGALVLGAGGLGTWQTPDVTWCEMKHWPLLTGCCCRSCPAECLMCLWQHPPSPLG